MAGTTNNAFIYCLALATIKFGIDVLFTLAESNHHHTIIFDRHGHVSAFLEHFHKLVPVKDRPVERVHHWPGVNTRAGAKLAISRRAAI